MTRINLIETSTALDPDKSRRRLPSTVLDFSRLKIHKVNNRLIKHLSTQITKSIKIFTSFKNWKKYCMIHVNKDKFYTQKNSQLMIIFLSRQNLSLFTYTINSHFLTFFYKFCKATIYFLL